MADATPFKYRAFLSYSHADTPLAKWLHARIEGFPLKGLAGRETAQGPVPASLRPVFRDRNDFSAGHSLGDETVAALDASAALIVLCSPAAAKSHYVNEEIRLFKWRHPGRLVVPVIADGKPGDPARECFPPALKSKVDASGAVTDAPEDMLAADLRDEGDGRELAAAKVAASLIGVASDEVYRRAERERRRQGRIRMAVAAVVLALAGAGGVFGWLSRQRGLVLIDTAAACARYLPADKRAAPAGPIDPLQACVASLDAMQKGAANDPRDAQILALIGKGKKEEAERLQLQAAQDDEAAGIARNKKAAERYRGIAATAGLADPKKAREYYAKAATLDPQNIEGMGQHAEFERDAGNLAEAERSYAVVLKLGAEGRDDSDLYWARLGLGDIQVAHGHLPDALKTYREAAAIAERLAAADPVNAGWQRDLSVSYGEVGDVLVAQGDLPGALKAYRDGLAIRERLAAADPGNAGWQRDLSLSNNKVGDVLVDQGDLPGALKAYRDSLAIRERLAAADPGNAGWQRDLSVSYEKVGDVLVAKGDLPGALKAYRDSLAIRERLAAADPGNAGWQRDLSVSDNKVGNVLVAKGDLPGALKAYRDSLAIAERLAAADPGNAGWQRDLSVSYNKVGDVLVAQGDLPGALKAYRDSLAIRERLAAADPGNAGWQRDLSVSYDKVGDVLVAKGDLPGALKAYRDSLAIRERLAAADPGNAGWQRDLAISYEKLVIVYSQQGDMALAADALAKGKAIMVRLTQLSPDNATWAADLAWFDARLAVLGKSTRRP